MFPVTLLEYHIKLRVITHHKLSITFANFQIYLLTPITKTKYFIVTNFASSTSQPVPLSDGNSITEKSLLI